MFFSTISYIDKIAERLTGPLNFRFIFQPLAAILLGIRDGKMDAAAGIPPFIFDLISTPKNRERHIKTAMGTLLKPIIIGVILDAIAQYLIFKDINLWGAVLVGTFIMGVPYTLSRGITNRIVSTRNQKKNVKNENDGKPVDEGEGESK